MARLLFSLNLQGLSCLLFSPCPELQNHSFLGYWLTKSLHISENIALTILHHHERWDGTGYPAGKSAEDIHIYGRIAAMADVYDALRHRRCYKSPWTPEAVLAHMISESGKQFEPALVEILQSRVDKIEAILQKYPDED